MSKEENFAVDGYYYQCALQEGVETENYVESAGNYVESAKFAETCPLLKGAITIRLNTTDSSEATNG